MAFVSPANLAGEDVKDVSMDSKEKMDFIEPSHGIAPDGHVPTLGEYQYYARLKRDAERGGYSGNGADAEGTNVARPTIMQMLRHQGVRQMTEEKIDQGLLTAMKDSHAEETAGLSEFEIEKVNARRMLRVAGWSTVFYLITTDILGPFNAPFAISNLGLVPGVLLYFFFGVIAATTGFMLSYLYNNLDSDRYPVRTYGDLAERIGGLALRHLCSVLQSIQLVVNVGIICLSSGQSLYQVSKGKLCFSICVLVWALMGMIVGQIISLRNFGVIGSFSVYINLLIIFMSMGVVAHSLPNYAVANAANDTLGTGPVVVKAFITQDLAGQVNGMFNMVFAYGGAMIFPEMMAEMRRPMDFYKGMACAQILIFVAYMMYGVFWYCFQGQYTQANAFQGLSPFAWQTTCNVLNMVTGLIAATLYGNIGIKVIYINIIEDMFKGPPLVSRKGRIIWTLLVPTYWAIAFVVGSAVPALGAMTGLVGAVCIFQFTYSLPPLLWLLFEMKKDAAVEDEKFTGYGSPARQVDTWHQPSRWRRALFTGRWYVKLFMFMIFLASLACAGLGLWGTGESVKAAFITGQGTSFGCLANA
jgi:amino acid permease